MNKFHPITILLILIFAIIFLTGCSTTRTVQDVTSLSEYEELTAWGKFSNWLGKGNDDTYYTDRHGFKQHDRLYGGKPVGSVRFTQSPRPFAWKKYQDDPDHREIHFWFK
jgi:hypothetical protein